MTPSINTAGWSGSLSEFIDTDKLDILEALKSHHTNRFPEFELKSSQLSAWIRTIDTFQSELKSLLEEPFGPDILVVLEYELPGEGGRRPDVILVTPTRHVFVIECKNRGTLKKTDIDQARQYEVDLQDFHSATDADATDAAVALLDAENPVNPPQDRPINVLTTTEEGFKRLLDSIRDVSASTSSYDPVSWLKGDYSAPKKLTEAVVQSFQNEELPKIKDTHRSSNVPKAKNRISKVTQCAANQNKHILVLLTGAPGSGKTMVGLQSTIQLREDGFESLYLSGNGPLVAVIQDALERAAVDSQASKSVIREMYKFKSSVEENTWATPGNVFVFDEGQRAWTDSQMQNYDENEISLLIDVAERSDYAVLIGLIGEGQAIHRGEKGGIDSWVNTLARSSSAETDWEIVVPDREIPKSQAVASKEHFDELHLETNIRAKYADRLHEWVDAVLAGDKKTAARTAADLKRGGYTLYITEHREKAEKYVRSEFGKRSDYKFGWFVSSQHQPSSNSDGLRSSFIEPQDRKEFYGTWFNAPREDPGSCCRLDEPVDEFGCQGLEIDFSLVCWGTDLQWDGNEWEVPSGTRRYDDSPQSPTELTKNVYRVLLTRGRDGAIIKCQDNRTRHFLKQCGVTTL
jgi:hypothetical protein